MCLCKIPDKDLQTVKKVITDKTRHETRCKHEQGHCSNPTVSSATETTKERDCCLLNIYTHFLMLQPSE